MVGWGVPGPTSAWGQPRSWSSNDHAFRYFCATCGAGLYYMNEAVISGLVDVQIVTLDDPTAVFPEIQVQVAECLPWVEHLAQLPAFDRYP